ncbi:NYN domain-containing protein [Rhodococcus sp. NCIMB 12038]|uniref:NYN domain-containing protein n=1 Tax=Rhodococcus sp. NCIMB 12038 TaxID=933800 RepID=UPI000B3C347F|nr:NYN domain-containing protein [Rhodococcus sp. NCIMB 12038]OUS97270.1 hypothetical protein CA951_02680 [Rhodococcus sp. NCIMB 12038]
MPTFVATSVRLLIKFCGVVCALRLKRQIALPSRIDHPGDIASPCDTTAVHLLDLENLVGGYLTPATIARAWNEYQQTVGISATDRVVVAVACRHRHTISSTLPSAVEIVLGDNGPDGADRALLAALDIDTVDPESTRVLIGSCDHIFAPLAAALRLRGVNVAQVIGIGTSSTALYRACPRQYYLPTRLHTPMPRSTCTG